MQGWCCPPHGISSVRSAKKEPPQGCYLNSTLFAHHTRWRLISMLSVPSCHWSAPWSLPRFSCSFWAKLFSSVDRSKAAFVSQAHCKNPSSHLAASRAKQWTPLRVWLALEPGSLELDPRSLNCRLPTSGRFLSPLQHCPATTASSLCPGGLQVLPAYCLSPLFPYNLLLALYPV